MKNRRFPIAPSCGPIRDPDAECDPAYDECDDVDEN